MNDVKFIFVRDRNKFPVGCFAYKHIPDEILQKINFGYSVYFFGDKFSRRKARKIAQHRLKNNPCTICYQGETEELVQMMLHHVSKSIHHYWAKVDKNQYRNLGDRFISACARTATKLAKTIKQRAEIA